MNDKKPLVSVVIPVYNGEKFVEEAIESVINQTYKDWEIIIVDDGSTDDSKKIIDKYLTDSRIHYIKHSKNRGIPSARNTGIKTSYGEYITLLDQDDKWVPKKLELQLKEFDRGGVNIGLIYGKIKIINSNGTVIQKREKNIIPYNTRKKNLTKLFLYNFIPSVTVMFKRKCVKMVGKFDENILWGGDDLDLWLRIVGKFNIAYIDKVLAFRRVHSENFSKAERMINGEMKLIDKVLQEYPFLEYLKNKKSALLLYRLGRYYHLNSYFSKARKLYLESISTFPILGLKPYITCLLTLLKVKCNRRVMTKGIPKEL